VSAIVEKRISLDERRARLLERLAECHGVSEDDVVHEGIDLLSRVEALDEGSRANLEAFLELCADIGDLPPYRMGTPIDPADIVEVVGTPPPANSIVSPK
jgi:hypothetical protein